MKKLMAIYKQFEIVVVPFPFTDTTKTKRRPALVVSDLQQFSVDKSVLAMITTKSHSPWSLDAEIEYLDSAGLKAPSIVRFKLFTIEDILIIKKIGSLSQNDVITVRSRIRSLFNLIY